MGSWSHSGLKASKQKQDDVLKKVMTQSREQGILLGLSWLAQGKCRGNLHNLSCSLLLENIDGGSKAEPNEELVRRLHPAWESIQRSDLFDGLIPLVEKISPVSSVANVRADLQSKELVLDLLSIDVTQLLIDRLALQIRQAMTANNDSAKLLIYVFAQLWQSCLTVIKEKWQTLFERPYFKYWRDAFRLAESVEEASVRASTPRRLKIRDSRHILSTINDQEVALPLGVELRRFYQQAQSIPDYLPAYESVKDLIASMQYQEYILKHLIDWVGPVKQSKLRLLLSKELQAEDKELLQFFSFVASEDSHDYFATRFKESSQIGDDLKYLCVEYDKDRKTVVKKLEAAIHALNRTIAERLNQQQGEDSRSQVRRRKELNKVIHSDLASFFESHPQIEVKQPKTNPETDVKLYFYASKHWNIPLLKEALLLVESKRETLPVAKRARFPTSDFLVDENDPDSPAVGMELEEFSASEGKENAPKDKSRFSYPLIPQNPPENYAYPIVNDQYRLRRSLSARCGLSYTSREEKTRVVLYGLRLLESIKKKEETHDVRANVLLDVMDVLFCHRRRGRQKGMTRSGKSFVKRLLADEEHMLLLASMALKIKSQLDLPFFGKYFSRLGQTTETMTAAMTKPTVNDERVKNSDVKAVYNWISILIKSRWLLQKEKDFPNLPHENFERESARFWQANRNKDWRKTGLEDKCIAPLEID